MICIAHRFASSDQMLALNAVIMLIEEGHDDAAHKAHIEIEVVYRKEHGERKAAHAHYFSQNLHAASPFLPAHLIVEVDEGRVNGLFMHNALHILVDGLARLVRGNDAAVHEGVRHPDDIESVAVLVELLLEQTLSAGHTLAADIVVHDDGVAVELLRGLPHLHEVAVAAYGVGAHGCSRVPVGNVAHHGLAVSGVNDVVARERVHIYNGHYAPAVIQPLHAVGIVGRAAGPCQCAVTRERERVDVLAHALLKDLVDLFIGLLEVLCAALLIEIDAEQTLNDGVERAVIALRVDIPAV